MFCFDKARPRIGAFLYKNFNDHGFALEKETEAGYGDMGS
jgi:hypothetical protein